MRGMRDNKKERYRVGERQRDIQRKETEREQEQKIEKKSITGEKKFENSLTCSDQ